MLPSRWLSLVCVLFAGSLVAQDAAELEVDHALTFDYPTPHTAWARPYVQGPTRVLFFTDGRGTMPRHCVELMERFELDAQAVFWARIVDSTKEEWHGGDVGKARLMALLEQPWDCYVFLGMPPTRLSAEAQCRLLEPVVNGAGIVLVGADDKRILKETNRETVPWLAEVKDAMSCRVGQGRGVRLPKIPTIDYAEGWELDYDTYAESLGRAILWAAGHEPKAAVEAAVAPASPLPYGLQNPEVQVTLAGTDADTKVTVQLRRRGVRDWDLDTLPVQLPGVLRVPLPEGLAADTYRLDAIARNGSGQVVGWDTRSFAVQATREIEPIQLAEEWGEVGGTIQGEIAVTGTNPYPQERVEVRLLDPQRRVLVRQDLAPAPTVPFSFAIADWMPQLLTVEALLLSGDREVCRAYTYFRVTTRNRSGWNFLIWDAPNGTLAPYAEASLAKHGVTLQLSGGNPPLIAAANNIAWVPYTTRIQAKRGPDGVMKPFCWNDQEAVAKHVQELATKYAAARQHGVFVWSLGDEVDTKGSCLSPHCLYAYRDYLRQQYGEIAALNASWGTQFAAWDEVVLSDPTDNDEATALRAGNYPRWFDRQAFQSWNFVQFCQAYRHAYEAIDPQAKVGFEGAGRFDKGDDIDLIVRNNTFWSPYPGTTDEVIRSIAPREFPRANWMGYTKDADSLLAKYWRMVTRGMDSVWWWRWDCIGRFHGWLAPDLRPFPAVVDILDDTRIVRDGLGDLLLQSEMLDDRVAVLYSFPSSLAQSLENGPSFGSYERSHLGAQSAVRELGMQFRYVTDRMLRNGEFDASRYRVLLLPRAEAMSDKTVAVIRQFAEQGGVVIADVRPAVFDEHLKPRPQGALDDLFGIARNGLPAAKVVKDDTWGSLASDPAVTLAGGTAGHTTEGTPLLIANKGQAILLNADWGTLPNLGLLDTDESLATWWLGAFAKAGVVPTLRLTGANGQRAKQTEVIRWQTGDVELLALFRTGGQAEEITVRLPADRVVNDLRTGQSLGRRSEFKVAIRPNRPSWFALLTNQPAVPELAISVTTVSAGTVVPVGISVPGAAGLHACRITVWHDGQQLAPFARNVVVGKDPVNFVLPMALNDAAGTYEVRAEDRYTAATTTRTFQLQAGRPVLP